MFRKLLPLLGKYKKYAILTPLIMIGEVLMEISIPRVMAQIIDVGIADRNLAYVIYMGLLMIGMALFSLACGAFGGRFAALAGMGFGKGIREKLFHHVQDYSFANVDKFSTGSLVTRLTTDITQSQNMLMMLIRMAVRSPLMLIGALIYSFRINARLALLFLAVIPFLAVVITVIMTRVHPKFMAMFRRYDDMNADLQENLIGIRVVKAFVREDYEEEKFRSAADAVRDAQYKAERIIIWNMPIMQLCIYGCLIAVLWFGGNMVVSGTMLTGDLISFITYVTQILFSLMMLAMIVMVIATSRASMERIVEAIEEVPDIKDGPSDEAVKDGSVEFKNVSFSYSKNAESLALSNINLSVKSGETIGIIGGTGSSKTSLVQLIPRLYDVLSGSVTVGGKDVREYSLHNLRNAVAMVLQKNVLFSGTIRDNLKWGNPDATDQEIEEACRMAAAHDFIMSFPDGYDTDLGQGGVNVSGGQKQRLCIARALLKKPKIIILDDSTSAVDTATDSAIQAAFRETLAGTTTFIIAQRISSVADADRIIVMDDGKIDAIGTHEELLENNRIYREVYESQQKGVA